MRLIHTSDWHLGHTFHEQPRLQEHAAFLDWLLHAADQHAVDAIVVAGDIFDSPAASNDAFELYYRFLARLSALTSPTRSGGRRTAIVVGGNHDSPGRLDAPREVLSTLATRVVGGYDASRIDADDGGPSGVLVPIAGAGGHVGVVVVAVPFLNEWRIGAGGFDASPDVQLKTMHERFTEVYARLADKAAARYPGVPLVATGHLTCLPRAGQRVTDEDAVPAEINRVGTLGAMSPTIFDARFSYVALGHIHRGFDAEPGGRVRYSGSPVQVSVAEPPASRRVLLVDIDAAGLRVEPLPVPVTRRLLTVRGTLEEVQESLATLVVPAGELSPYVSVRVSLREPDPRVVERVGEAAAKNAHGRPHVVEVQATVERIAPDPARAGVTATRVVTPDDALVFAWQARYGRESSPTDAVLQRFKSVLEQSGSR